MLLVRRLGFRNRHSFQLPLSIVDFTVGVLEVDLVKQLLVVHSYHEPLRVGNCHELLRRDFAALLLLRPVIIADVLVLLIEYEFRELPLKVVIILLEADYFRIGRVVRFYVVKCGL